MIGSTGGDKKEDEKEPEADGEGRGVSTRSQREIVNETIRKLHQKREEILARQGMTVENDTLTDGWGLTDQVEDSDEGEDDSDEDEDEEPLILQLLESMFARKKTVQESMEMQQEIDIERIRQEFRTLRMAERVKQADQKRSRQFQKRMQKCERLNRLIQADNEENTGSIFEKPDPHTRDNPFFLSLKAQQIER